MTDVRHIRVAIALVWRDGALLVSRRKDGQHLGGYWEFPGGKIEAGETAAACAEREVLEEVGAVAVAEAERPLMRHEYADRVISLHPVDCRFESGEPTPREVAEVRWVAPRDLCDYSFPAANAALIAALVDRARRTE